MRRPDRNKHTGQPGKAGQRAQRHSQGTCLAHSQRSCPGRRALAASGQRPQRTGRWQQHRRRHLDGIRQIPHLPTLDPAPAGIRRGKSHRAGLLPHQGPGQRPSPALAGMLPGNRAGPKHRGAGRRRCPEATAVCGDETVQDHPRHPRHLPLLDAPEGQRQNHQGLHGTVAGHHHRRGPHLRIGIRQQLRLPLPPADVGGAARRSTKTPKVHRGHRYDPNTGRTPGKTHRRRLHRDRRDPERLPPTNQGAVPPATGLPRRCAGGPSGPTGIGHYRQRPRGPGHCIPRLSNGN